MYIGDFLLKKGIISELQKDEVLEIQITAKLENKSHKKFGEILIEKGYIDKKTLEKVLTENKESNENHPK